MMSVDGSKDERLKSLALPLNDPEIVYVCIMVTSYNQSRKTKHQKSRKNNGKVAVSFLETKIIYFICNKIVRYTNLLSQFYSHLPVPKLLLPFQT